MERIYVTEAGLRVLSQDGRLPPNCEWEDGDYSDHDDYDPEVGFVKNDPEMAEIKRQLAALLAAQSAPSRARLAAQRVRPFFQRLIRGTPCAVVWAGMLATFFWNAAQSFDEQALAAVIDLPEEVPARFVAAAISTAVFAIWSCCFKATIQNAVERKLDAGK